MYDLNTLNEKQREIVYNSDGAVLVSAGAGSGKTRLLTHKVAYLIAEKHISPLNILAITFTNKATNEMKERIQTMVEDSNVWISTFHSMCAKILRENISHLEGYNQHFSIYDTSDKTKVIKALIKEFGDDEEKDSHLKDKIDYHISNAKNMGLTPQEYEQECSFYTDIKDICKYYSAYEKTLKENNALDFDDLLMKTYILFKKSKPVLEYYQNKFKYILVDEFQDTNPIQYKLVKLLSAVHKNIFVVGDEDQSIYGWRGASIENIKKFITDFDNVKVYKLEQNYRSTKNILNMANTLISHNNERLEKTLFTENEDGENVTYSASYDEKEEGEYVARTISNLHYSGVEYGDIAILMRINSISRVFEEKLLNYNIPFVVTGGFKFFERLEIKNLLAYMSVVVNPQDTNSLARIINYPKRGIGDATLEKIKQVAFEHNVSPVILLRDLKEFNLGKISAKVQEFSALLGNLFESYERDELEEFVENVIKESGILEFYNTSSEEDENRRRNINEFVNSVKEFCHNNPDGTITDYLQSVTLQTALNEEDGTLGNCVTLSTVHSCKGLEFDYVFVVGSEEGIFPLSRRNEEVDVEEERRLMYVAVTRARKKLYMTRAKSRFLYNERGNTIESRFLKEMGIATKPTTASAMQNFGYTERDDYSYGTSKFGNTYGSTGGVSYPSKSYGFGDEENGFASKSVVTNPLKSTIKSTSSKYDAYTVGKRVLHPKFGVGEIIKKDGSGDNVFVTVSFATVGNKTLSLAFAPLQLTK